MKRRKSAWIGALVLILSIGWHPTFGQVLESDSLALVALYDSSDGPNWADTPTWLNGPVPSWEGVTVSEGRVTQLRLLNKNLTGRIPAAVAALDSLKLFWLSVNNLEGPFPAGLIGLPALESIDLSLVNMTGSIPAELGSMTRLTRLNVSRNELEGQIPPELANLVNIQSFQISSNNLTGEIPAGIWQLPKLQHLQLNDNDFTGTIPESVGELTDLQSLLLSGTQLSGTVPASIGNLTQLNSLWLGGGDLSGSLPASLGNLSELFQFFVQESNVSGPIPPEFGGLAKLQTMRFGGNKLSGSIPPELGNLESIREFWLDENELSGGLPEELGNLTTLTSIRLRGNAGLTGPIPLSFTSLTELSFFDVRDTDLCAEEDDAFQMWIDSVQTVAPNPLPSCSPATAIESDELPQVLTVYAVYPNPTRSAARIEFYLPEPAEVVLTVFDALGRRVAAVSDAFRAAGHNAIRLPTDRLTPGVYLARLRAGEEVAERAFVVAR